MRELLKLLAHPTRFERVAFAFGGQTPTPPVPEQRIPIARRGCCKPPATAPHSLPPRNVLLSMTGNWAGAAQFHFSAVAQTVGLVYEKSKMLYFDAYHFVWRSISVVRPRLYFIEVSHHLM